MPLRAAELAQHSVAQQPSDGWVLIDQLLGRAAPVAQDDDIVHRFGRIHALARIIDAEAVTGEAELGNMAAAVGEQLADPHCPGNDLVPEISVTALGIDLGPARKVKPRADSLQCYERVEVTRWHNIGAIVCRYTASIPMAGVVNLPIHSRSPSPFGRTRACSVAAAGEIRNVP